MPDSRFLIPEIKESFFAGQHMSMNIVLFHKHIHFVSLMVYFLIREFLFF
jgi:hypothetical protein